MNMRTIKLWIALLVLIGTTAGSAWAQDCASGTPPAFDVVLALQNNTYNEGEPIYAALQLTNRSGAQVVTSKGFMASYFVLMLQFVDEKGNLITSDTLSSITAPTPPPHRVFPVTTVEGDGTITKSELIPGDLVEYIPAGYDRTFGVLPPEAQGSINNFNLLDYYPLEGRNGYFTVEAVISMRTYPASVVQTTGSGLEYAPLTPVDTANWCGALRSNIVSFIKVGDADGDGYLYPGPDCDDTNAEVNPGAVEIYGDGIDNDCNPATADAEPPPAPGYIQVQADRHVVGIGSYPGSTKSGIKVLLRLFDRSSGSCLATKFGVSWQQYPLVWAGCPRVAGGVTGADGAGEVAVDPGDYMLIAVYDPDDSLFETSPSYSGDEIYMGRNVGRVESGQRVPVYLQTIEKAGGKKVPGKYTKRTGSELLIIEPEYVEWDGAQESYPFIFEGVGDWSVTTAVAPPEGFVADQESLSEEVNTEVEAVQFTIRDVGSEWVATGVVHDIKHKGKKEKIKSKVEVKLSKRLAKEKGLDVFGKKIKPKPKKFN
jgi:hypothetical protein